MKLPPIPGVGQSLVQNSEYAEQVIRALGVKGEVASRLETDLSLGFTLDDFTADEFAWLRRSTRWSVGAFQAAVAAQFSIAVFGVAFPGNPGRATMAVIDHLVISNPAAATAQVQCGAHISATGIANPATRGLFDDDRQFGKSQSVFGIAAGTNAAAPIGLGNAPVLTIPPGGFIVVPRKYVLSNVDNGVVSTSLGVVQNSVNTPLAVGIFWRERTLFQSEL